MLLIFSYLIHIFIHITLYYLLRLSLVYHWSHWALRFIGCRHYNWAATALLFWVVRPYFVSIFVIWSVFGIRSWPWRLNLLLALLPISFLLCGRCFIYSPLAFVIMLIRLIISISHILLYALLMSITVVVWCLNWLGLLSGGAFDLLFFRLPHRCWWDNLVSRLLLVFRLGKWLSLGSGRLRQHWCQFAIRYIVVHGLSILNKLIKYALALHRCFGFIAILSLIIVLKLHLTIWFSIWILVLI